ncbi:bacteriohemerythrin [Propionispira raffinosivorans]|uniref:bacteriohemerythrin n=1 Tax=Propionispira raffinosivorans TaxID=86959 RepID=UPI00035FA957|nr:bacteriohemerythrin [Propionispira raffinosivorans]
MAIVTWTDEFSVGIPKFDEEHKKLVTMINNLHAAMKEGRGKDTMEELLLGLTKYVNTHFSHEETLMAKYNYPNYEKHKKIHDDFKAKVIEYKCLYDKNLLPANQLLTVLRDWLIKHICDTDRDYGPFLEKHM